jgi:phenylacetate-CoA ligase
MGHVLKVLYSISPAIMQSAAVSLYGLRLYAREYGQKFERLLDEFNRRQWDSPDDLAQYRDERIRELIRHCYDNVPYYHRVMSERKLTPDDIQNSDDLQKMPVLNREEVRLNISQLKAANANGRHLVRGHTNGTTGSPLEILWDKHACLMKNVVDWRQKSVAGVKPGDKIAFFFGREVVPKERRRPPFWRENRVLNHMFYSTYHLSSRNAKIFAEALRDFNPKAVEGYPASLYIIASFLNSINETLPVDCVFCTSEPLFPHYREVIEKAFACKVYDFYGMAERVIFSSECEYHDGKHINSDYGFTEIHNADGEPAAPGEMGRIVATGLHNYGMPLIRYQTSDFTAMRPEICECGRGFPLMENITARDVAILTATDGRLIIPAIMSGIYDSVAAISELQLVQEERDLIVVNLVRRPGYSTKDEHYLTGELKRLFGADMRLELNYIDDIPRTQAGKYRWMISKVPLQF